MRLFARLLFFLSLSRLALGAASSGTALVEWRFDAPDRLSAWKANRDWTGKIAGGHAPVNAYGCGHSVWPGVRFVAARYAQQPTSAGMNGDG